MKYYLDFEQELAETNEKIEYLQSRSFEHNVEPEIIRLKQYLDEQTKYIYNNLTDWQITKIARHPQRPKTMDYIKSLFTDFLELKGDRHFADDQAIIGGFAKYKNKTVVVIGHQKGANTKENIKHNFAMPKPEGYRKALRLMELAEKFSFPLITFVDTPGAYPGIGAEERCQSEAIGKNIAVMCELKIPIVVNIIGEGGSGGALAIAVGDYINMLQYSIYSVISPDSCAAILWKDASKAYLAAEALSMTATKLQSFNIIDDIITEPLGGSQHNYSDTMYNTSQKISAGLKQLGLKSVDDLISERFNRLMSHGLKIQ